MFLSSIVLAQTSTTDTQINSSLKSSFNISKEILKDPTPQIDERLDKDIIIPDNVQMIVRIVFGIKGDISVSALILLLAIWTFVLLFLGGITPLIPLFNNKIKAWFLAFIINLLIALGGTYVTIAQFTLSIGEDIKFLKDWSAGLLFLCIVTIIVFFYLFNKIFKKFQERMKMNKAREAGQKIGRDIAKLSSQTAATEEFNKILKK